jgi:hypothetical protein
MILVTNVVWQDKKQYTSEEHAIIIKKKTVGIKRTTIMA